MKNILKYNNAVSRNSIDAKPFVTCDDNGKVTFYDSLLDKYNINDIESGKEMYYIDKNYYKINNFGRITNDYINENFAPYKSMNIGLYDGGELCGKVYVNGLRKPFGERLYRFGVLSDVHNQPSDYAYGNEDLCNALTFLNSKEDVDFVCICGDLTIGSKASEAEIYKRNVDECSPDTPVYVCAGNHDCKQGDVWNSESAISEDRLCTDANWKKYTGMNSKNTHFKKGNDNFIMFSMNRWNLGTYGDPFSNNDISWLSSKLEELKNERTFIFLHLFFPFRCGNYNHYYNNSNWLGGKCYKFLVDLADKYQNTVWFSGHSHFIWDAQGKSGDKLFRGKNYDANIYPANSNVRKTGWCVHVSGCAYPKKLVDGYYDNSNENWSEFAIVDVYDDYIDIRGISFVNGEYKYIPIAQYRLDTKIIPNGQTSETRPYDAVRMTIDEIHDMSIGDSKNIFIMCPNKNAFRYGYNDGWESIPMNSSVYSKYGLSISSKEYLYNELNMQTEAKEITNRDYSYVYKLTKVGNNEYTIQVGNGKYFKFDMNNSDGEGVYVSISDEPSIISIDAPFENETGSTVLSPIYTSYTMKLRLDNGYYMSFHKEMYPTWYNTYNIVHGSASRFNIYEIK